MPVYYDFTIPIHENMGGIPSGGKADAFSRPTVRLTHTIEREGWLAEEFTITTHSGTHIDFPAHMLKGGETIDKFSLADFIGEGVVLNIPKAELEGITDVDLERAKPKVQEGDIVLINTGWWKKWEPFDKAMNDYVTWKHPGIVLSGAKWLAAKKIKAIGIDANAVHVQGKSNESDPRESVHHTFLSHRIPIIEGLTTLDEASGKRGKIFIVPLPLKNAGGTLVRVFMESVK